MNFFSHFMVDHQIHRPNFNVGLIAPDLLRNFTPKHCKFDFVDFQQQTSNHAHPNNPALHDFFSGCLQHIERDKEFHQSPFFQEAYQTLRESWRNTCLEFNIPKYWFSLHVLIEMMLDKYFIDNNLEKLEKICSGGEPVRPISLYLKIAKRREIKNGEIIIGNEDFTVDIFDISWRRPLF